MFRYVFFPSWDVFDPITTRMRGHRHYAPALIARTFHPLPVDKDRFSFLRPDCAACHYTRPSPCLAAGITEPTYSNIFSRNETSPVTTRRSNDFCICRLAFAIVAQSGIYLTCNKFTKYALCNICVTEIIVFNLDHLSFVF